MMRSSFLTETACSAGQLDTNSWICNQVQSWTGDVRVAQVIDGTLGTVTRVLTIVIAALVARFLLVRLINRVVDALATSPAAAERERERNLADRAEAAIAAVSAMAVARRSQRARTLGSVLRSITNVVIGLIAVLMIMQVLGYPIGPLLASAGIVGVALGFGAQTLVKDFLSGVFMLLEDQFGVGDVVDLGEAIGTVESVGLRITKLRDFDGTLWYVRNGEVLRVQNRSQGWGRAMVDLLLAPSTDLTEATRILITVATEARRDPALTPLLRDDPEVVSVESIEPQGVTVRLMMNTQPLKGVPVARELRVRALEALGVAGIELARPAWPTTSA